MGSFIEYKSTGKILYLLDMLFSLLFAVLLSACTPKVTENPSAADMPDGISIKVDTESITPEGASFILFHPTEMNIQYGDAYKLQKLQDSQWEDVPTIIENYAFHSCKNLETVKFRGKPKSVSDIAFAGCDKLKNFPYPTEDRPLEDWYDPDQYKDVEEKPAMFSQGPARTMLISNWSNFFFKFLVASGCYLLATRRKRY